MICILTGAKKNVGDYLIGSRARKLLRKFVDTDIVELDRFKSHDDKLELLNSARAVFLCGGPAYAEDIYPEIYPLVSNLEDLKVPVVPFGLGWAGQPFGHPEKFKFKPAAKEFLDRIHVNIKNSSCRDDVTHGVLKQQGYSNVLMTGCPVWYDLGSMGKELEVSRFDKIVYTTPAAPGLMKQNGILMRKLKKQFPKSKIICSFHRGIYPDRYTSLRYGAAYSCMALEAKLYGFEVVDTAYGLDKINFYKECDLHVGYRVHAHLDFLSRRKPSVLINEDGRGLGMVRSLGLPELNFDDECLVEKFDTLLARYRSGERSDLDHAVNVIEKKYSVMREFLGAL